jgi:multidrug efflux pump subunit AcrA (membrane-fusion protein)
VGGRVKMDEEDKIFRAKVLFDDKDYKLKVGMTVNADIITERRPGLLIIPREAVFSRNNSQEVYLIDRNVAREKTVELGSKDPDNVEIKKGLKDGEIVAITNIDKLKNGSLVKTEK